MIPLEANYVKRAHAKDDYTRTQRDDLQKCSEDPLYFMKHFVRVQHPIKGSMPFDPYEFQKAMISAYNTHRFNVSMASRQLGKCSTYETMIISNGKLLKIGSFIGLSLREKIVNWLENIAIRLAGKL